QTAADQAVHRPGDVGPYRAPPAAPPGRPPPVGRRRPRRRPSVARPDRAAGSRARLTPTPPSRRPDRLRPRGTGATRATSVESSHPDPKIDDSGPPSRLSLTTNRAT